MSLTRRAFSAFLGAALLTGAKARDDGWHHVHGANGLTLSTTVPLVLSVVDVDGTPFRLADHRGRVVVLNLFATWCGPCNAEASDLAMFASTHADDTTVVSVDVGEPAATARSFGERYGVHYQLASDESSALCKQIGMSAYPTTLFVRPDGRLACAFVGQMSRDDLEAERLHAMATP